MSIDIVSVLLTAVIGGSIIIYLKTRADAVFLEKLKDASRRDEMKAEQAKIDVLKQDVIRDTKSYQEAHDAYVEKYKSTNIRSLRTPPGGADNSDR